MNKNPQLTKQKIKDAFLELYTEKSLERITIKEVTERARVYRGTFYYYYEDIYDLYSQIESEIEEIINREMAGIIAAVVSGNIIEKAELVEDFYEKYDRYVRLFLVEKPNAKLLARIKTIAKGIVLENLGLAGRDAPEELKYMMEFVGSGQIGLITMWIAEGKTIDVITLSKIMKTCTKGFFEHAKTFNNPC